METPKPAQLTFMSSFPNLLFAMSNICSRGFEEEEKTGKQEEEEEEKGGRGEGTRGKGEVKVSRTCYLHCLTYVDGGREGGGRENRCHINLFSNQNPLLLPS